MKDLGITGEMFVTACEIASQKIHKSIVNQLLAVENFLLFKKMMMTRNKQLNEEAIKQMKATESPTKNDDAEEEALKAE